ncbi:disulfide bond formation protein B [Psychrosphaera saromensis]|uniref:disulfide bond formation protein DsbB n=1 Tax=Psychrosphaera saromensis TaxID=716813 RepID=UPI0015E47F2F|nr:disulfide bond formation protein DsbB [Psychrosphaera saromensis]GHB57659.1 disulfide bond formation protein B [Psychrosphaera saromensis]GLQ14042.1 disulfide bond formation protein B [Psychrosphaera saromensis]
MFSLPAISTWPALRWPWFLVAAIALILESIALYFQYGMGLEPCIMCIYQRVAVFGIVLSALPALVNPHNMIVRLISISGLLVSCIWGLVIALEHVEMQNPDNFMLALSCDLYPNFPDWLQLHTLIPSLFEARGTCGDIDWSLFGFSMPQIMVFIFSCFTICLTSVLAIRLLKLKTI